MQNRKTLSIIIGMLLLIAVIPFFSFPVAATQLAMTPNTDVFTTWTLVGGDTYHYESVDEYPTDNGDTSYILANSPSQYDLFDVTGHTTESGTIASVTVYCRAKPNTAGDNPRIQLMVINTSLNGNWSGDITLDSDSWKLYSHTFTEYADGWGTNRPWTWEDIDNLGVGVWCTMFGSNYADYPRVTQIYAKVNYGALSYHPPTFDTPSPTNNSIGNTLSFNWGIPISDADGYFDWTIQCSNGQQSSANGDSTGTKSLSLSGLAYHTTYKVYVNATDGDNTTRAWYQFTTYDIHPPVFGTPSPVNSSTNQNISFTWGISITDAGATFNWTINCSNGQHNEANSASNGTKTLSLYGLDFSTVYTVWVNATDGANTTRAWYQFTTKAGMLHTGIDFSLTPGGVGNITVYPGTWFPSVSIGENFSSGLIFYINNTGNVPMSVTVNASNSSVWHLGTSPSHNQFQFQFSFTESSWTNILLSEGTFISSLAYDAHQTFSLKVFMPTSSSSNANQTSIVTFKATAG